MIIAIGTENKPKVEACQKVIGRIYKKLGSHLYPNTIIRKTSSNVSDMPLSQDEMMAGAKNRAYNLFAILSEENIKPDYTIGMEGGFYTKHDEKLNIATTFLQSWVYVFNGKKGQWGSSGGVPVPESVYQPVMNDQLELAEVIDRVSGKHDVRSKMGAVGIFTDGIIVRQEFFENALTFAFAPFYNKLYG